MSDRVSEDSLPSLEVRMDDLRAVLDSVGSERAAILGWSEGGNLASLFAATHPERTKALVLFGCFAKRIWSPDYPWAPTIEERESSYAEIERTWGEEMDLASLAPSMIRDQEFMREMTTYFRQSASPGAAVALLRMNTQIDIRQVLPSISVPTLVLHRTGDLEAPVEGGRWIAAHIPNAQYVELSGDDHLPFVGDQDGVLDEVETFLTGVRPVQHADRVLATVMFTDICDSTAQATLLGDQRWRELLEQHHALVRAELSRFRGREVDTAGDGFFAIFDGPARAIRCACSIRDGLLKHGIRIRAGVHTGELEMAGEKVSGIAIHIGARVATAARATEVLVSNTVKDLIAGSNINLSDYGSHELKGLPGVWQLYAAI